MTIEELRLDKRDLEQAIVNLIDEFEKKTNVGVRELIFNQLSHPTLNKSVNIKLSI